MNVYLDTECKCHTTNPDGIFREVDAPFFEGKCRAFIEGHRCCPPNESYVRDDGKVFYGECVVAWKPYDELDAAQTQYEIDKAEAAAAYQEGVDSAYDQ